MTESKSWDPHGRPELDLMQGAIDLHVHAYPDLMPRIGDELEIALVAKEKGMRAILFKSAYGPNPGRLRYVRKSVPEVQSFGGVVLNPQVGGLNPSAVEAAIKLGAKAVWMPTVYSEAHFQYLRSGKALRSYLAMASNKKLIEKRGVSIFDEAHNLLPQVDDILGQIADANILLATGHLGREEIFFLVDRAVKAGVKKILVTHPNNVVPNLSAEDQAELVKKGAVLEHCLLVTMPLWRNSSVENLVEIIKKLSADKCVLATDFGQVHHPPPPEGLRMFLRMLLESSVDYSDLERMVKINPSKLLGIDA